MTCRRDVLVLGWRGALPSCNGFKVESVAVEGLRTALARARRTGGAVLLVGDGALECTPPLAVLGQARRPWCIPVIVPGRASWRTVLRWRDAGATEVLDEVDLEFRLHAIVETPVRGDIPQSAWAPRAVADAAGGQRLLALVPTLVKLRVEVWAERAGRSDRALRQDCLRHFGVSPRDILWAYVDVSYRAGRRDGRAMDEMAEALGYFDLSNLCRAYRNRGLRFPG